MLDNCDVKVNLTTTLALLVVQGFVQTLLSLRVESKTCSHVPEAFVFFDSCFFVICRLSSVKTIIELIAGFNSRRENVFLNNVFHTIFFLF